MVHAHRIFRSGQLSESLVDRMLEKHQIETIIDLTAFEPGHPDQEAEKSAAKRLGIDHRRYPLTGDGKGDPRMYQEALRGLSEAVQEERRVLVHCAAGAHRTGGLIATWRLLIDGWDADAIVDEMVEYDWRRRTTNAKSRNTKDTKNDTTVPLEVE